MTTDETKTAHIRFLQKLKSKGKSLVGFEESLIILQDEAASRGLENEEIFLIIDIVKNVELSATKCVALIKCMIPVQNISNDAIKDVISWCLTTPSNTTPVTVSIITLQWIIGLWEYELVDKKAINMFYEVFFYTLLKKDKLETHLARIIYELTKPEDVTRRQVIRILSLQKNYKKPQKHLNALLSLFKSYKPELVPEKIPSVAIGSTWKPIPDPLRIGFENAKQRATAFHETRQKIQENFKWTFSSTKGKSKEPILPSVEYFHIGSSIFKEKDTKSIFDISDIEQLGKYHMSLEMPSRATSLLTNMAGYHLLTFADHKYQYRFTYNLYNTLRRGFLIQSGKYSREELEKLLDMTYEFLRYLQHGILVVTRFIDEYLTCRTGEFHTKLLALMQWTPLSISVAELQEYVLKHLQVMFRESSLEDKCEIIRTLQILLQNLFFNANQSNNPEDRASPFLGQISTINLTEIVPVITKFTERLIISGLNIHAHNLIFLSEAFSFYEQVSILENYFDVPLWTFAPSAVIYSGLVSRNCLNLTRVCSILLDYRKTNRRLRKLHLHGKFSKESDTLSIYANDLIGALWYEEPFSTRHQKGVIFLSTLSKRALQDIIIDDLDLKLSLSHHYAILPYKYVLNKAGLEIQRKEDLYIVAVEYFPPVSEFLRTMGVSEGIDKGI